MLAGPALDRSGGATAEVATPHAPTRTPDRTGTRPLGADRVGAGLLLHAPADHGGRSHRSAYQPHFVGGIVLSGRFPLGYGAAVPGVQGAQPAHGGDRALAVGRLHRQQCQRLVVGQVE